MFINRRKAMRHIVNKALGFESAANMVGRKVAHVTPRFQVQVWSVCCILFDAYHNVFIF